MSARDALIADFLARNGWAAAARQALAGDASFRRYERLTNGTGCRLVLMDAPPPQENVRPFVAVARHLVSLGLSAPRIHAADEGSGLLLIEDFGDDNMAALVDSAGDKGRLYRLAVDSLIALHRRPDASAIALPAYDDARMLGEAEVLLDWYLPALTGAPVPERLRADYRAAWQSVLPRARAVPTSLVLRDYFPDNLMLLAGRKGVAACGLLDFQDAVIGPVTYDLVSLLEDARRDVPAKLKAALMEHYLAAFPALERQAFAASYAIMGAQRNLRIVGVFTRLCRRDGKRHYLAHIPRLWRLIEQATSHPALAPVEAWLARHIPPALRRIPPYEAAS
ncbi:MAG: aminoglycoside phosphotransferase family protein [Alphaproteobacteria bacterium]